MAPPAAAINVRQNKLMGIRQQSLPTTLIDGNVINRREKNMIAHKS
jgi:hypothetical protein